MARRPPVLTTCAFTFAITLAAASRPSPRTFDGPWLVGSDWDDTIVEGGNGKLVGVRGIGQHVNGTYPGMTTLLAELDVAGRAAPASASFQV